jgi:hypothetical protein
MDGHMNDEPPLKKMTIERVGLMEGLLKSTKPMQVAVVSFTAKARVPRQKIQYQSMADRYGEYPRI